MGWPSFQAGVPWVLLSFPCLAKALLGNPQFMSATFMEDHAGLPTPTYCDLAVQVKAIIRQGGVVTTDPVCEFHGLAVALYDRVSSFYEKQVGQESIRTPFGICEVSNQLRVRS